MKSPVKRIIIVGGGTAGWMSAILMAHCWKNRDIQITLVESPNIGTIGVGEGSTPQLKAFFDFLGIQESEWMPKCYATYKNGITFSGWSTKPEFSSYFHSFESELDFKTEPAFFYNCSVRRKGVNIQAHPDRFYLGAQLTRMNLGPKPNDNFPFEVSYGYHFDASLLGQFFRDKAEKLGVVHIEGKVESTHLDSDGYIKNIRLDDGTTLDAELFVDCSGFSSLLMQQALKVPFVSFGKNLFNDAAVTLQTPFSEEYNPQTISTALSNGWVWRIPLINRTGNGYVYSSSHCSADEAETELRRHLNLVDNNISARHLKMKVGRVEKHWYKNCLAVGLSQGFIEPLEATALHLVQETIQGFIDACELGEFTNVNQDKFNQRINARFEGVRDYIVTHYILNSRQDTEYWQSNRNNTNISDSLKKLLSCWASGKDLTQEILDQGIDKFYTSMSWHSIFAGYGFFPDRDKLAPGSAKAHRHNLADIENFLDKCSINFAKSKDLLISLQR